MADFVTLSCPTCGGKLQVAPGLDRFACAHCGNEHVVRRGGGIVSLAPVVEGIDKVRMGVDKTASELAIRRLREEIPVLRRRCEEEKTRLQLRRTEKLEALRDQRLIIVLALAALFLLWSAVATTSALTGLFALASLVAAARVFYRQHSNVKRMDAEVDAEIAARTAEFDIEIAAKVMELDAHTSTVRVR